VLKQFLGGLAATFLVACGEPTTATAVLASGSTHLQQAASQEWIDEAFDFSVPAYLNCLDETATWSGTVLYHYHHVVRPDGSISDVGTADLSPGSTLVGPSGTWSTTAVRSHFAFVGDNVHIVEHFIWTNVASRQRMDVISRYRLVVAGNGRITHETSVDHECTLQ